MCHDAPMTPTLRRSFLPSYREADADVEIQSIAATQARLPRRRDRSAATRARMAWLVDLSERGAVELMGEQGLLAEDVHAGSRGRQAARQQQEACRARSSGSVPYATSRTGTGAVARVATIWAAHRWPRPRWVASCRNAHPGQVGTARSISLSMIQASSAVQARNQAEKRSSSPGACVRPPHSRTVQHSRTPEMHPTHGLAAASIGTHMPHGAL
jgi:hypothetical protein